MAKKYLFSPVGGNDPISASTEYDGSMLHICRYYQPDKVYLYLSKEMLDRQREDQRYTYCIEQLGERIGHTFETVIIERPELEEVQEYDRYYKDFGEEIQKIRKELSEEDRLYVNIASGTPAMKSALLLLSVMSQGQMIPVQVKTPLNSINPHKGKDRDYDPEYYWEIDKDNEEENNRCSEPECPNLVAMIKKEVLVKQIQSYNYAAARLLAEEIRTELSERAYRMIEIAVARKQLDLSKVDSLSKKCEVDFLPVKQGDYKRIFEYALSLKIKLIHKEYGDFMRAISPVLADLFELIAKASCGIRIKDYCEQGKKDRIWRWSLRKLEKDETAKEVERVLQAEFGLNFKDGTKLAASNIKPVLVHFLKDEKLKETVEEMREIEIIVRHRAAHEIISITDDSLKKFMGKEITFHQIFLMIKRLTVAARIPVKEEDWNSYDEMNRQIIAFI